MNSSSLPITAIIAAKNEIANIRRCLGALALAKRIVVVDSHSSDGTIEAAREMGAEVVQFSSTGEYPKKRQWALDTLGVGTPWVLLLDADEVVPSQLWVEISEAILGPEPRDAYLVAKGFHFLGRQFRFGGFSHQAVILFRPGRARFERLTAKDDSGLDMEVHERLVVDGRLGQLRTPLIHEDRKGLQAYIDRHNRYSTWEAALRRQVLDTGEFGELTIRPRLFGNAQERRRWLKRLAMRLPAEPWLWFVYHYWLRLGFLEGHAGLIASRLRAQYVAQVRAKMYERLLSHGRDLPR